MGFKEYVNSKGYTLNALSKKANVPYTTIKSIHQYNSFMKTTLHNVVKIADALEVSVEELINGVMEHESKLIEWGFSEEQTKELMKGKEIATSFGRCRYNKKESTLTIKYTDGRADKITKL